MLISKIKLKERLFDYYTQNFYKLVVPINRTRLQAYFFLSVYFLQLLSITLTSTNFIENHTNSINDKLVLTKIQNILEYFMIYPIWRFSGQSSTLGGTSIELQFTIGIAICNAVIVSCIILQIVFFGFSARIINFTNRIVMSLFIFYRYILIIPTMRASEQFLFRSSFVNQTSFSVDEQGQDTQQSQTNTNQTETSSSSSYSFLGLVFSIFNASCAMIFGLLIVHHDFTYSFQTSTDKLARRKSIASKIIVVSDIWLAVLNSPILTFSIQMVFALIDLYSFSTNMIFYDFEMARFYFQISSIRLLLHVLLLLSFYLSSQADLSVVLILAIPIIWQIADYIVRFLQRRLPHMSLPDFNNPQRVDLHLRSIINTLINIQHSTYLDTENGVLFESILHRHIQTCLEKKEDIKPIITATFNGEKIEKQKDASNKCPCKDLNTILKEVDNNEGVEVRKKLILLYLNEIYLFSKKNYSDNLCATFYYLAYLVEISESPVNAFLRLIEYEVNNSKNLSLHYQMILADLKMKAQNRFENSQKMKNSLKKNLLDGIKYDQWLNNLDENLIKCLKQLKSINNYMTNETIDLYIFHKKCKLTIDQMNDLESYFQAIYQINPYSRKLQELLQVYIHIFDIRKYKLANIVETETTNNMRIINDISVDIFSEKNCILFVSFLQQIGTIKLATKNSESVIGRKPSQLKDQSINKIIPQFIAKYHDQIIKKVISNGYLQGPQIQNNFDQTNYQFFFIDSQNFIFPILCQMKIQIFGKCKDFGVSALLKKPTGNATQNAYILLDRKISLKGRNYQIQNITKQLYRSCFSKILGENCGKFIYLFLITLSQKLFNQTFVSLKFYPINVIFQITQEFLHLKMK